MAVLKSPKNNKSKTYWRHCKANNSKQTYLTNCINNTPSADIHELSAKITWRSSNYSKNRLKLKAKLKLSYFC